MVKYGILALALCLTSCDYSDMGSNFKLYHYDDRDVYVGYCFNRCDVSSFVVIPSTVLQIEFDDEWIIAKRQNASSGSDFWIVRKDVGMEFRNDHRFVEALKSNVYGPLSAAEFDVMLYNEGIDLSLD